jgi:5S rRNA maturation endonuclease (ribonuclease M5)
MIPIEDLLGRLKGVEPAFHANPDGPWQAYCPAHDDRHKRSLSIAVKPNRFLLHCFAGCKVIDQIVPALQLRPADLFNLNGQPPAKHERGDRRIVATYDYQDERGTLLYQVVRFEPKDFRPRRPDGTGGWIWDLKDVRRVVYRLPELAEQRRVVLVEGEKDVDRLRALGISATTSPSGALSWRDDYAQQIAAAAVEEIVVIPDHDASGCTYATTVATALQRRGIRVRLLELPGLAEHGDVSDWLDAGHEAPELRRLLDDAPAFAERPDAPADPQGQSGAGDERPPRRLGEDVTPPVVDVVSDYIEPIAAFLSEEDTPINVIFPALLPCGVVMLLHGEPRARKSLAAFELALAAATGTAPFGLERFTPSAPIGVFYIQEEDPRSLTRPRLRRLVQERCGACPPATLHVAVRRGVDLDDPLWVARLIADLKRLGAKLLVLDAARRLSTKTDEGPAKVRELIAVLRAIVTAADVTIVVVHHDIKPPQTGQDQRRRSQRASGGDWFAGCECPVHVEKIGALESLIFPEDYKFTADPVPFTFTCQISDGLVTRLIGADTTTEHAERAGVRGKVFDWLRANGPATKTDMKKAGLAQWPAIEAALDELMKDGKVDSAPGRKRGSLRYFVTGEPSKVNLDGSGSGASECA